MANIVTGRVGEPHITSDDDRARHIEQFGKGKFVFNVGKRFDAVINNGAHTITISDGMLMSCGTQMGIEPLNTETVSIENGVSGYKRYDLIVMQYTRDTVQDVESAELVVKKGAPVVSNPVDPVYTTGDIMAGATLDETPIWRVVLDGNAITGVEAMISKKDGKKNTSYQEDPEGTGGEVDPTVPSMVITDATIDKLWGMALPDGDAGRY